MPEAFADPWETGHFAAQALLLAAGLALEGLLGGLPALWRRLPHPVALFGRLVAGLDRRLNREARGARARFWRGVITVVLLVALAGAVGWAIHEAARAIPYGWLIELAVLAVLLAGRNLFDHVRAVARALERGGLEGGRAAVRHIVGRDVSALDEAGVARAAIESAAENFSDGVVAPCFWYLLLGLPGLLIYKAVNTMDSMIGYRTARHEAFGKAAARLDDGLNYLPARLSAILLVLAAAVTPGASPRRALVILWRDGAKHASPNAGRPEAAMAGALGRALGGPRAYRGEVEPAFWLGDGRAVATPRDIDRALRLYGAAWLLLLGGVGALALLS